MGEVAGNRRQQCEGVFVLQTQAQVLVTHAGQTGCQALPAFLQNPREHDGVEVQRFAWGVLQSLGRERFVQLLRAKRRITKLCQSVVGAVRQAGGTEDTGRVAELPLADKRLGSAGSCLGHFLGAPSWARHIATHDAGAAQFK